MNSHIHGCYSKSPLEGKLMLSFEVFFTVFSVVNLYQCAARFSSPYFIGIHYSTDALE